MIIFVVIKKEKYILKNRMVIWVLKSRIFYSLYLVFLFLFFMCYLREYFVLIFGVYSIIIYDIKRN